MPCGYDPENGLKNYRRALEGKGHSVSHGPFQLLGAFPTAHALHGYPLSFITRPLDNARLDRYLHAVRESKGNRVFGKRNSARPILQSLKSAGTAGILMDQNASLQEGIFVDFFGIPAATSTGMAILALRTGAPVLPGYLSPMRNGLYLSLLPHRRRAHGQQRPDLKVNTKRFNEILEQIIREQPESWLWGHKRWKYQPEEIRRISTVSRPGACPFSRTADRPVFKGGCGSSNLSEALYSVPDPGPSGPFSALL